MKNKTVLIIGGSIYSISNGISALVIGTISSISKANNGIDFSLIEFGRNEKEKKDEYDTRILNGINIMDYKVRRIQIPFLIIIGLICSIVPGRIKKTLIKRNVILEEYNQSEVVVNISAGDSFSDIYGYKSFLSYFALNLIAILFKKPLIFFPQTIGPFNKTIGKILARFILKKAQLIFTRESYSTAIVKELCGEETSVIEKVDMAFLMEPELKDVIKETNQPVRIGLNISGFLSFSPYGAGIVNNHDYLQLMIDVVGLFIEKYGAEITLIPHDFALDDNDVRACENILNSLSETQKKKVKMISGKKNGPQIKGIIAGFDFFVGARLHACIAALSMAVPTVTIAYSHKFLGILETLGLGREMVCDPVKDSHNGMIEKILWVFENREGIHLSLTKKLPEITDSALSCGSILNELFL